MIMNKEKVLVAGANGTTGRHVVKNLRDSKSYQPIAMIRKKEQEDYFEQQNVSCVLGDLENDISHVTKGIDKVIFAAGSKGKNVIGVDQEGAKRLIDASEKDNIQKFVMLSSMGADNPSKSDDLEDYLKAKQNADQYLQNSNLTYTIVRPGALTDDNGKGKIKYDQKLNSFGEISREDVAHTLVQVLDDGKMNNEIFEIIKGNTPINEAVS
jgi:uncharacterized protein YbjT (DUF2867 family)